MKHVGILTFSNTVNYGASLQACALRRAVESLGCDCEILNYSNRELDDRELGTHFSFSPSGAARYFLRRGFERRRVAAFSRFAETNLNLTSRLDRAALIDEAKTLDCILIGSDQVFNPRVNGHDPVRVSQMLPASPRMRPAWAMRRLRQSLRVIRALRRGLPHFRVSR